MPVVAFIGEAARAAVITRTGRDPGRAVELDLSTTPEELRAELMAAVLRSPSPPASDRDALPCDPSRALVLYAPRATDISVAALVDAIRQEAAERVREEMSQASRHAEQASRRAEQERRREEERASNSTAVRAALPQLEALVAAAEAAPDPDTYLSVETAAGAVRVGCGRQGSCDHPFVDDATLAAIAALAARLRAAAQAADARRTAARETRQAAVRAEQAAARAEWLRDHATDEQRERAAAGMLPAAEVAAAMEELVWAPFGAFSRYQLLTRADVEHDDADDADADEENEERHPVHFSSEAAASATAAEFARLKVFRALAPGATITLRRHEGWCEAGPCPPATVRMGIRVEITTGGTTYRREFEV